VSLHQAIERNRILAERLGLSWAPEVEDRLAVYVDLLLRWNKGVNLTGAGSPEVVWKEHLIDAVPLAAHVPAGSRVVDVGSGGGLPAIPFAVLRPDVSVLMVEPRVRRGAFLRTAVRELGLAVGVHEGRAETLGPAHGLPWDVATSRATLPPSEWLELGRTLVHERGGIAVLAAGSVPPGATTTVAYGDPDPRARLLAFYPRST
jgi:16S rRNA (guanine527-N7)-methyltransferase